MIEYPWPQALSQTFARKPAGHSDPCTNPKSVGPMVSAACPEHHRNAALNDNAWQANL